MIRMTAAALNEFLREHFPEMGDEFEVTRLEPRRAEVRMRYHPRQLRPGGTISGPSLMLLADTAMYVALLGMIGPVALAVTTSLHINFLRKPSPADVIAEARLLKLGRRLAVGDVIMYSDRDPEPVAQATVTYSIPPQKEGVGG